MLYGMKNEPTPCAKCLEPLDDENLIPLKIYMMVRDQHIMSINGPVDLNLSAVYPLMDVYGVRRQEREWCLNLVIKGYQVYRKRYSDE
jgi:hypothetical protein